MTAILTYTIRSRQDLVAMLCYLLLPLGIIHDIAREFYRIGQEYIEELADHAKPWIARRCLDNIDRLWCLYHYCTQGQPLAEDDIPEFSPDPDTRNAAWDQWREEWLAYAQDPVTEVAETYALAERQETTPVPYGWDCIDLPEESAPVLLMPSAARETDEDAQTPELEYDRTEVMNNSGRTKLPKVSQRCIYCDKPITTKDRQYVRRTVKTEIMPAPAFYYMHTDCHDKAEAELAGTRTGNCTGWWDCPCEECQAKREKWSAGQPPMVEELPAADEDDDEDHTALSHEEQIAKLGQPEPTIPPEEYDRYTPDDFPSSRRDRLEDMTVKELRQMAKERNIATTSRTRKAQLIDKIIASSNHEPWVAVWGNSDTTKESGVLGTYPTHEEASKRVDEFLDQNRDNPACGAWIRRLSTAV